MKTPIVAPGPITKKDKKTAKYLLGIAIITNPIIAGISSIFLISFHTVRSISWVPRA